MKISSPTQDLSQQESVTVTCNMNEDYPHALPGISLTSAFLTRQSTQNLRNDLMIFAGSLIGEPMLMELRLWLEDNWTRYIEKTNTRGQHATCDESHYICLLHLDHMRAKAKYVKMIEKSTSELTLTGRLLFCEKLILILLQGDQVNIKVCVYII